MKPALSRYLDVAFGIDLRTLALFRIVLGTVIAVDLLRRLSLDLVAFHTGWGVLPGSYLLEVESLWRLNLMLINEQPWFAALTLLAALTAALAMIAGYRTRVAVILLFVLMGSIHNRNPMILIGGDLLIMCLLFWSMFLPLQARVSVDAARAVNPPPTRPLHRSWASAGILIQVMSVYFFSAVLKNGADWWPDGLAVYYTMELERYATPLGRWALVDYPTLMQGLSYYVYFLEWIGPILVFLPIWTRMWRFTVMLLLMAMHVGFILCMEIGHFPYVSLSSLTLFLGGWAWDVAARHSSVRALRARSDTLRGALRERLARRPVRYETGPGAQRLAALALGLVLIWNLSTIDVLPKTAVQGVLGPPFRVLRIDQLWNMFAPFPSRADGWMVFPGVLEDGREVDVLKDGAPVDWAKPAQMSTHRNLRWHTYRWRIWEKDRAGHRLYYGRYLCREWNARAEAGARLVRFEMVWMQEFSQPPGQPLAVEPYIGWTHQCVSDALVPQGLRPVPKPPQL